MSEGLVLNGRFRLIEKIDSGGMGSVWRAEDMELEAEAAVKLIEPELLKTPEALERFKREAKAAAAIRSTHVVQIFEYGVQPISLSESRPYIAMELLRGENLATRLERVWRMSPDETLAILTHVARALSVAHAAGIVHRDLKPENVFLVREMGEDVGKILDFGVARQQNAFSQANGPKTQAGSMLGTPYYMSPEQTVGEGVDHRSDVWAFGVIAYECLLGVRPFDHETLGGLFNAICVGPRPVPSRQGAVPDGFDAWFARATARDIKERFQTIEEALRGLRTVCGQGSARSLTPPEFMQTNLAVTADGIARSTDTPPPSARTIASARKRRSRVMLVVGSSGAALIACAGLAAWQWSSNGHTVSKPPEVTSEAVAAGRVPAVGHALGEKSTVGVGSETAAAVEGGVVPSELPLVATSTSPRSSGPSAAFKWRSEVKSGPVSVASTKKKQNVAGF